MDQKTNPTIANPARTALQGGAAVVITEFVDAFLLDFSDKQYLAAVGMLTLTFSWAQALIETKIGRALFKQNPSD